MDNKQKTFFISYNKHDRQVAEWIAYELEEAGYGVIIQAWDFKANWIHEMDNAMQTCSRTIAVLSPHYVNAEYTFTEWANAFKDDAKGTQDKLVTIRVADFEPGGILGQLVYVDFVDKTEEEARDLLLKRVKGMRLKPSAKPPFNLHGQEMGAKHTAVLNKPAFPAAKQDQENLLRVTEIAVQWRKKYSVKLTELEEYITKLRAWQAKQPSVFTDDMDTVITVAWQIAGDFKELPLKELEKINSYGAGIHQTVFWGQALSEAFAAYSNFNEEERNKTEKLKTKLSGAGMPDFGIAATPDRYQFEMLERVIRSAISLARFDISDLPRGFIDPGLRQGGKLLHQYKQVLMANLDDDPRLYLLAADKEMEKIQSFAARPLRLSLLGAKVNTEGTMDIIAQDNDHLYLWEKSAPHPVYQWSLKETVLSVILHKNGNDQRAHFLSGSGTLYSVAEDGGLTQNLLPVEKPGITGAVFFTDPLHPENWYVIISAHNHQLNSYLHGKSTAGQFINNEIPWHDLVKKHNDKAYDWLVSQYEGPFANDSIFWRNDDLQLTVLDGFPCVLLSRTTIVGTILCFLDPVTLGSLRLPVILNESFNDIIIAAGRWLVAGLLQGNGMEPRIKVWDLRSSATKECGSFLNDNGDIYSPTILSASKDAFEMAFIHRYFDTTAKNNFRLLSFTWPGGEIRELGSFEHCRIWPAPTL